MITTIEIKEHRDDVFQVGSGKTKILILGSCRTVPYLNYLNRYNVMNGDPFTIYTIEPNNWSWDLNDNPVDRDAAIAALETNDRILSIIRDTDIFIHEWYAHFGMFNTNRDQEKNIYQFNMAPALDILIPNFHDRFILEHDYTACGIPTPDDYLKRGEDAVEGFRDVCLSSSFPEFGDVFFDTWRDVRYFWRPNHVSASFTLFLFRRMNSRFLHLNLTDEFMDAARQEDLFKEPHTHITQRDIEGYGLRWLIQ